ncbi:hypothetical protein [Peribacillus simplex]|nr:hypothetical protein [Peribacillus simplex]
MMNGGIVGNLFFRMGMMNGLFPLLRLLWYKKDKRIPSGSGESEV